MVHAHRALHNDVADILKIAILIVIYRNTKRLNGAGSEYALIANSPEGVAHQPLPVLDGSKILTCALHTACTAQP